MRSGILIVLLGIGLVACEGPMGPQGPAGQQGSAGATGPAGPAGPSVSVLSATVQADAVGAATGFIPNASVESVILQCWTRPGTSGSWVQLAFAPDADAPNGFTACGKTQDGADVNMVAVTEDFWWVLFVAIISG